MKESTQIANALIQKFSERFKHHWLTGMRAKIGLQTVEAEDEAMIQNLLDWMAETKADCAQTFAALTTGRLEPNEWQTRWQQQLSRQPDPMRNPWRSCDATIPPSYRAITKWKNYRRSLGS